MCLVGYEGGLHSSKCDEGTSSNSIKFVNKHLIISSEPIK